MVKHKGFTLIELLVVVTIIVVLLALLSPALDKAIYQAELTGCGARLHAAGNGVLTYAMDSRRWYPYRQFSVPTGTGGYLDKPPPNRLTAPSWGFDFRPTLRKHVRMDLLRDPFCPKVGIDIGESDADTAVDADYLMWFGWQYLGLSSTRSTTNDGKGMNKMGDRLEWGGQSFRVLAADWDDVDPGVPWSVGTHPDSAGVMAAVKAQDAGGTAGVGSPAAQKFTCARWASSNFKRGTVELNLVYDDGSVIRLGDVKRGDPPGDAPDQKEPRITRLPLRAFATGLARSTAMPVQ